MNHEAVPRHGGTMLEESPLFPESPDLQAPSPEGHTTNRTEALGAVSITELIHQEQIDPESAVELARHRVGQAFYAAEKYGRFTPAVASAIAHHEQPSTAVFYPTAAQIKEESFGARFVSGFLGFFSPWLADRFDRYLERKARRKISYVSQKATDAIDAVGSISTPKTQLVQEIANIHNSLRSESAPQDRLPGIAQGLAEKAHGTDTSEDADYPLLNKLVRLSGLTYHFAYRKRTVRAFAPEIIKGIEQFLKHQGVEAEPVQAPEYPSLTRRVVHRFAPRTLNKIPHKVEAILTNVYSVLPEDGKRFKQSVYALCRNIAQHAPYNHDGRDLTKTLVEEVRHLLKK